MLKCSSTEGDYLGQTRSFCIWNRAGKYLPGVGRWVSWACLEPNDLLWSPPTPPFMRFYACSLGDTFLYTHEQFDLQYSINNLRMLFWLPVLISQFDIRIKGSVQRCQYFQVKKPKIIIWPAVQLERWRFSELGYDIHNNVFFFHKCVEMLLYSFSCFCC